MNIINPKRWHLITGEYPPDPGGVSDYTHRLAEELAAGGAQVEVWTGKGDAAAESPPGITIHRVAGDWEKPDLRRLNHALDAFPGPRLLVVQYTPNAFKRRGMNIAFCRWLRQRAKNGDEIRIIFHEVRYLERPGDTLRRRILAQIQRLMASQLLRAATTVYVTIPYWDQLLTPFAPRGRYRSTWLPVPSNIPRVEDRTSVEALRLSLAPEGSTIIGNFGTFHDVIGEMVAETLPPLLLDRPDRVGVLIGRGGESFAEAIRARYPELGQRLIATGDIDRRQVARYLQACDLMVQPYPDGVCTKRGSIMAALANGAAVATTLGFISEPLWANSMAVALAPDDDLSQLVRVSEELLSRPEERLRLRQVGQALYEQEFSHSNILKRLTQADLQIP